MTHRREQSHNTVTRLSLLFGILILTLAKAVAIQPISVELHSYGFPSGQIDLPNGVFYMSPERVALYFDRGEAADSPNQGNHRRSHQFLILVVSTKGQVLAQQTIYGLPKALDIKPGPAGGLIVGREGSLSFYDADLHLQKSVPLSPDVTGVSFDRRWNQLTISSADETSDSQTIKLLDGVTLEARGDFTLPKRAIFMSGNREIGFDVGGDCQYSTQIISKERSWDGLRGLPICGMLTFVGDDALAYTFDQQLYVTDHLGKQLSRQSVPAPDGPSAPFFSGISDDNSRIAIWAWKHKTSRKRNEFPDYKEVFVYDLSSHKRIFSHPFTSETTASALSPDGKQLATIEDNVLILNPIP
jgi:hypothetical protein